MCKYINAPMFLSRGDTNPGPTPLQRVWALHEAPYGHPAVRWRISVNRPTMRKWGCAVQPLVKRRDDLLFNALEGLDVTGRDGAEHDLVDTGVNELADSIDDVI